MQHHGPRNVSPLCVQYCRCGKHGASDGHGKEWLEIVNQLNKEHPELDITLFADEKEDDKKIRAQNPAKYQFIL